MGSCGLQYELLPEIILAALNVIALVLTWWIRRDQVAGNGVE